MMGDSTIETMDRNDEQHSTNVAMCIDYAHSGIRSKRDRGQECLLKHDAIISGQSHKSGTQTKKICLYFIRGRCKYGSKCPDIHSPEMKAARAKNQKDNTRAKAKTPAAANEMSSAQTGAGRQTLNVVNKATASSSTAAKSDQTIVPIAHSTEGSESMSIPSRSSTSLVAKSSAGSSKLPSLVNKSKMPETTKFKGEIKTPSNSHRNVEAVEHGEKKQGKASGRTNQQAKMNKPAHHESSERKPHFTTLAKESRPKKTCEYFLKGRCKFGDKCLKAHDQKLKTELSYGPNPSSSRIISARAGDNSGTKSNVSESLNTSRGTNSNETPKTDGQATPLEPNPISATGKPKRNNYKRKNGGDRAENDADKAESPATDQLDQHDEKVSGNGTPNSNQMPEQDEHCWIEETWDGVEKRVNAKFSESTKNFPPLATLELKGASPQLAFSSRVIKITGASSGNAAHNTENAITKIQAFTKSWSGSAPLKESAWNKPINIPQQLQDKPRTLIARAKVTRKSDEPWQEDEMIQWSKDNLPEKTRNAFLRDYYTNPKSVYSKIEKPKHLDTLFARFSELPAEIRIQIWEVYLREVTKGQTIRLRIHYGGNGYDEMPQFYARSGESPLLRTNRESREIALKHYEKAFASNVCPAITYFDFRKDKLFIHTHGYEEFETYVRHMNPRDRHRVRCVILPLKDWAHTRDARKFCILVAQFHACRSLVFVTGNGKTEAHYRDDPKFPEKFLKCLKPIWVRKHGSRRPLPTFRFEIVDALIAKSLNIDTFNW